MATMEDVSDLVVSPFRDIVEKGLAAVENAGDVQPMLKDAQDLVKEGRRAVKRIEPVCKKHLEAYGTNFLVALKENDELTGYRSELTELLWEFDDFIEVDDFEADKFAELRAMSRKVAPKILDILICMKLEPQPKDDLPHVPAQLPTPVSPANSLAPPLSPPKVSLPPLPASRSSVSDNQSKTVNPPPSSPVTVQEATDQLRRLIKQPEPEEEPDAETIETQLALDLIEQPPLPPTTNPWDHKTPLPADRERRAEDFRRRAPVEPASPPTDPALPTSPQKRPMPTPLRLSTPDQFARTARSRDREDTSSLSGAESVSSSRNSYTIFPSQSPRARNTNSTGFLSPTIPEDAASDGTSSFTIVRTSSQSLHASEVPSRQRFSRPESMDSNPSSVFDHHRVDGGSADESERRGSAASAAPTSPTLGTAQLSPVCVAQNDLNGLEAVRTNSVQLSDNGLIPVETENEPPPKTPNPCVEDCSIGSTSSFYLQKGFCEGAQDVIRGGIGVRKTKKPVGFTTAATVARCRNCFYELDFKEIELDVNKEDRGNFTKSGIGFRIRFLQKSHIATKRVDEVLYGCVFCVHQGHTMHPSDATVFFNQKSLFQHLARHPRPLPDVPGFVVVDHPEMPDELKNNYDIHFKSPVEAHPAAEKAQEMAVMPTGSAKDNARRMYGQRLLFDRTPALELMQGARITGIEWMPEYHGEWAFAWHDGIRATIPTDLIRLDAPPSPNIKLGGTSHVRAMARWKFNPKEKGSDWLKFDKGEIITNIGWPYPDHWCWSGTNAKGKWGIFPQVFIDTNTVKEFSTTGSDRASILNNEKNRSLSMLSRFATRKSSGRPSSIAGSTSSQETPTATFSSSYMFARS